MADIYRDGVLYNVGKAIKNGQDYQFDWTMLNEYNQLSQYMSSSQADIRNSIQAKGVEVPNSATLDEYPGYIDQIPSTAGMALFLPSTLTVENIFHNSDGNGGMREQLYDTVSPNEDYYYHYFRYQNDSSTAYSTYRLGVFVKTAGNNPTFTGDFVAIDEPRTISLDRVVGKRMKKDGNDVKFSLLYTSEYDSDWHSASGRSMTYYCANFINATCTTATLGTISGDSGGGYSDADVQRMYSARETSCGLTSSDVLPSMGLTSLSMVRQSSYRYNLYATLRF